MKDVIELAKKLWVEDKEVATELANVIFKLRDEPEFEYPIYKRNRVHRFVVKFTDLKVGTVITPSSIWKLGDTYSGFVPHTNGEVWLDVPYDKERGLYHGQPVTCGDEMHTHARILRFYDAINKCTFSYKGRLDGVQFNNIEAIPLEHIPDWMHEAYRTLEGI